MGNLETGSGCWQKPVRSSVVQRNKEGEVTEESHG